MLFRVTLILLVLLSLSLTSCVGTVESSLVDSTLTQEVDPRDIEFDGVQVVRPVSHNKLEVYFRPAIGGSGKYIYKVFYGDEPMPFITSSEAIRTLAGVNDFVMLTLEGLETARRYAIRVDVEDQETGSYYYSPQILEQTTFTSRVADFEGVSAVENLAGIDGVDGMRVRWVPGQCIDSFCSSDYDIADYEILAVESSAFDFYDLSLVDESFIVSKIVPFEPGLNETIIRGLKDGTSYVFIVRALHETSVDNVLNPQLRGEDNLLFEIETTLLDTPLDVTQPSSFEISDLPGIDATRGAGFTWSKADGIFDHYRLYYKDGNNIDFSGADGQECTQEVTNNFFCKKIDFNIVSSQVGGLSANTAYSFLLRACVDDNCSASSSKDYTVINHTTQSESPLFLGIEGIELASSLGDIGTATLTFTPVDFSQSYIDGYNVYVKCSGVNNNCTTQDWKPLTESIQDDSTGTGGLYLQAYDVFTDSEIKVSGIKYESDTDDPIEYTFKVIPYVSEINDLGELDDNEFSNEATAKISNPNYQAPTREQFEGLAKVPAALHGEGFTTLQWIQPTAGVYDSYELYYIQSPTANWHEEALLCFANQEDIGDFSNSCEANTKLYSRIILDKTEQSFFIGNAVGTFGFYIVSRYVDTDKIVRSELNVNKVECIFNNTADTVCSGGYE